VLVSGAFGEGDKGLHFISSGGSYVAARVKQQFVAAEGAVYTAELKALKKAKGTISKQEVARVVFNKLDRDGTGKLELAEVGRLLVLWGLPSYEAMNVLIERDTNKDGVIDLQEFTEVCRGERIQRDLFRRQMTSDTSYLKATGNTDSSRPGKPANLYSLQAPPPRDRD
jgi:hypothetical protein